MKRKSFLTAFAFIGVLLSLVSCNDKAVVPAQLPAEIQSFVQQTFPNQAITYAEKDWKLFGSEYDVVLADGTQISFGTDKVWDKVESHMNAVPASLVPAPIATFVNTNYPSVAIVKLDKKRNGYEVELANDLELKFNQAGALMGMDD